MMSGAENSSKLIAMLDAISTPDSELTDYPGAVSPDLEKQIRCYALKLLSDWESDPDDAALDEEILNGLALEPQGLLLLRSLMKDVAAVEAMGPVPNELIEAQRRRLGIGRSPKPADFIVQRSKSGLGYVGTRPTRTSTPMENARDASDATTSLQHTQNLNHCEIKVTIETDRRSTFTIVLKFTFVDPLYAHEALEVTIADDAETVQMAQVVDDSTVEFEGLPAGSFTIEILSAKKRIDEFRAELRLDADQAALS